MHDLLNLFALSLSGMLGAILVTPTQRKLAVVKRRIRDGIDRH